MSVFSRLITTSSWL